MERVSELGLSFSWSTEEATERNASCFSGQKNLLSSDLRLFVSLVPGEDEFSNRLWPCACWSVG